MTDMMTNSGDHGPGDWERRPAGSSIGRKIRQLRKQNRLTLEELANRTGSSRSYIWQLENKAVARPSGEKIVKIATVLGVPLEFLLDDAAQQPTGDDRDLAFFRRFRSAAPDTKEKLSKILDLLSQ